MYEKVGSQMQGGNNRCSGIIGIVDVPYLVLEPTHNKQDFADQKEYKHLLKSMSDHMLQYWKDSKIESQGVTKFWDDFGYGNSWKDDPSDEAKFKMKRLSSTIQLAQCDECLKWRELTFSRKMINYVVPPTWVCSNNTDIALSRFVLNDGEASLTYSLKFECIDLYCCFCFAFFFLIFLNF